MAKAADPKGRVIGVLQGTIEKLTKLATYCGPLELGTSDAINALRLSLEAAHEMDAAWAPFVAEKPVKGFQVGDLVDLTEKRRAQYEGLIANVTGLVVVKHAGKSMVVETTDDVRMFLPTAHFSAHVPAAAIAAQ